MHGHIIENPPRSPSGPKYHYRTIIFKGLSVFTNSVLIAVSKKKITPFWRKKSQFQRKKALFPTIIHLRKKFNYFYQIKSPIFTCLRHTIIELYLSNWTIGSNNPSVQAYHAKHLHIFWRQRNTARSNPEYYCTYFYLCSVQWIIPITLLSTLCHSQNPGHNPFCINCYFYTPDISLSHQYYWFHDSSALANWSIKPTMNVITTMCRHFVFVGYICVWHFLKQQIKFRPNLYERCSLVYAIYILFIPS